jgi:hypothetical protein
MTLTNGLAMFPLSLFIVGCGGAIDPGVREDAVTIPPGMISLFDGKSLNGWIPKPANSWDVEDAAMHGLGVARGFIYTSTAGYGDFRLLFSIRHLPTTGGKDHAPCVLIWGSSPALDALGGIQFQPPNGGHWDYRPGHNNGGGSEFKTVAHTKLDNKQWNQCEILAHSATGQARMACCTLVGGMPCTGVEVLDFNDPTAGRQAPIAWQVHNGGLHDEFKDVFVELNPAVDDLISTHW